jgi:hypothetical protein
MSKWQSPPNKAKSGKPKQRAGDAGMQSGLQVDFRDLSETAAVAAHGVVPDNMQSPDVTNAVFAKLKVTLLSAVIRMPRHLDWRRLDCLRCFLKCTYALQILAVRAWRISFRFRINAGRTNEPNCIGDIVWPEPPGEYHWPPNDFDNASTDAPIMRYT